MRRLDSVTKSPVFSLYGEASKYYKACCGQLLTRHTVAGVAVIRAFGASARVSCNCALCFLDSLTLFASVHAYSNPLR